MSRVPVIGGKDLDLHLLYILVTQKGGIEKVVFLLPSLYLFYLYIKYDT